MEVLALYLILYFQILIKTANGNSLPTTLATSQIEPLKTLTPNNEDLILNNCPITALTFSPLTNPPNVLPVIENGAMNSEILQDGAVPVCPPTSSFLKFAGNSALNDFTPSILKTVESQVLSSGCNSSNDVFSRAKCMSNFKALRDSIEAYTKFILSSNSVFKSPLSILSSGDSFSNSFENMPYTVDSLTSLDSCDDPQPSCVKSIKSLNPHLNFLNITDSGPSHSQSLFSGFNFPRAKEMNDIPLVSHSSDLLTHAPCVNSLDSIHPDFRFGSDSCQTFSQSILPLLNSSKPIDTFQCPLVTNSQITLPVLDSPIETSQSRMWSQCTSPRNFLPTVPCSPTVNLPQNLVKLDNVPSFSSSSAFSLPITVNCIDCNSCSLCPLPEYHPTVSQLPVEEMIEDCILSTPNTLAPPLSPKSSSYSPFSFPSTVSICYPPVCDSFLVDDVISNNFSKVSSSSSLSLPTERETYMISVKNLLPSSCGTKSTSKKLLPDPLALPPSLPKLPLETTCIPLLPKSSNSLNSSLFEIPDLHKTMFHSLVTPIFSAHDSTNLSLPSPSILTPTPLIRPSFSSLNPPSMVHFPSPLSSNCLSSTIIDLPSCFKDANNCSICGSSIVSDQTALNIGPFSKYLCENIIAMKELVPEPNAFLSDRKSEVKQNDANDSCSFLNDIMSMICKV